MEAMRESWTDDRLDDLNRKTDALRLEMKAEFTGERNETKAEFATVRSEMNERFEAMMDHLYAMQRLMIQFCTGALVTLLAFLATRL